MENRQFATLPARCESSFSRMALTGGAIAGIAIGASLIACCGVNLARLQYHYCSTFGVVANF